jgi:RNA polymerase sigma factor (sigma-70 family)
LHTDLTFEQLVRDHQAMVFRTLLRLTGSREHVDDLAQEVFLRLYRITVNVAQDEWKRRRRDDRSHVSLSDDVSHWEERLHHPDRNAEEQIEEREFRRDVEEQLQKLSAIERTILVLYHQEERSYEQIAYALSLPIGTVRTHLHRGRKKLREGIQERQTRERRPSCTTNR